jgi:sporulation protein YlmC with PRC-barrel domain
MKENRVTNYSAILRSNRVNPVILSITPFLLAVICCLLATVKVNAAELTVAVVANQKGDGPDGKGNTADDTWQFWFELAHKKGAYHMLDTYSTSVPKDGVPRKVRGPIASMLPNPEASQGWIYHRDWDGRFEGAWGDSKADTVALYPYVEKNAHCAVAVTYKVPKDGKYDISGTVTDLAVAPQFKQHDGIDWIVETAPGGGPTTRVIGKGGPVGDGNERPESQQFSFNNVELKQGQHIRLVIHPRKWWGSDLTQISGFRIVPTGTAASTEDAADPTETDSAAASDGYRTWTDKSGEFKVKAKYVRTIGDIVLIRNEEGKGVRVPIKQLSEEDQRVIEKLTAAEKKVVDQ